MAKVHNIFIWKKAPFLRLLLPVITGIIIEYYCHLSINLIEFFLLLSIIAYIGFSILPLAYRFKLRPFSGCIITTFIISFGMFLTWNKDSRNHDNWYGNKYDSSSYIVATISEPLVEKNKSYKAIASVDAVIKKDTLYPTKGKLLLYFSKDSVPNLLIYGSRIIIKNNLQEIKNSGNPAAFNYKRYCAFQQIFHQCYLKNNNWILLKSTHTSWYWQTIFASQKFVVNALNKYITGKDQSSIADALLIGYKVDLDKDMVQAYSNAGVVHIIVIAGLHLGLIYALLIWFIGKIPYLKNSKVISIGIILLALWFFALLTGASPPVLRAVVMFSIIAVGQILGKKATVYNSLSASAFFLLCLNPYSLWDAGFQLSYLAVTGIVTCQRYVHNWFYIKNKILREAWEIASVSLAAQLFTFPVCLYYFHQIPLLFIITNILAIPIAIGILYGCILLVAISKIYPVAFYLGKAITALIWLLNHIVLFINAVPFSLWDGVSISVRDTFILYIIIFFFLYWLIKKNIIAFKLGVAFTLTFTIMMAIRKWDFSIQKKIIVYNVPSHKAIDFINGNTYQFEGDSDLIEDGILQNFHLKPARISFLLQHKANATFPLFQKANFYQFYNKRIVTIDSAIAYDSLDKKINVDYIIISKNPKLFIPKLAAAFNCGMYIFDASNPLWKIEKWKKDCEELHLHFHSVPEQGAFVIDL